MTTTKQLLCPQEAVNARFVLCVLCDQCTSPPIKYVSVQNVQTDTNKRTTEN